jgi:hypothetical protein
LRFFFAVLAAGLLAAALAGAALSYDGSYLMYRMLEGRSFWVEHGRLTHALAQAAPLLASIWTHDLPLLAFLLTAGYACLPLVALLASWWMVRDRAPELFVWAALGAGLAALPGLFCFVSDTMLVEQLAWPLFLGALVGIPRRLAPLTIAISLVIGTSHPVGFILFAVASALSWVSSRRAPEDKGPHRRWAGVFLFMAIAVVVRVALGADAYEKRTFTLESFTATWDSAVLGSPLLSVVLAWVAGALVLGERMLARRGHRARSARLAATAAALSAIVLSGMVLLPWAANPKAWVGSIGYRLYLGFAMAPFIVAAFVERALAWRSEEGKAPKAPAGPSRLAYAHAIAVVFAAVLAVQSWSWHAMTTELRGTLESSTVRCVSFDAPAMRWAAHTALSHWSISTYSLLVQGDRPRAIVLPDGLCEGVGLRGGLYLTPWYTGGWDTRWFSMDRLRP